MRPAAWSSRKRAGRDLARAARRSRGRSPRPRLPRSLGFEPEACRRRACSRSRRTAPMMRGRFHSRAQRRAMVRPAPAGAHPSLYDPSAPRGDRAGRARATSCAFCSPGSTSPTTPGSKARTRCLRRSPARRLRGAGEGLGDGILPARIKDYQPSWLDAQCLAGRTAWTRLTPPPPQRQRSRSPATPVGSTPIALIDRRRAPLWMALAPASGRSRARARAQAAARRPARAWRPVLRRARATPRIAASAARRGAGRTRGAGARGLRQLRRPQRAARAVEPAQVARRRANGADGCCRFDIESGGRWA